MYIYEHYFCTYVLYIRTLDADIYASAVNMNTVAIHFLFILLYIWTLLLYT